MLVTSIFPFSHNVFLPSQKEFLFLSYIYFVVCKCFQFEQVKNCVVLKMVKEKPHYLYHILNDIFYNFRFGQVQSFVVYYRLNSFPNKPWFLHVCSTSLLKTLWEKEKLLVTSDFSSSHSFFYPFR